MKSIIKKLCSKSGESLVETMAAVLIFTLSSIILLSMVAAAAKLNSTARTMDEALSEELFIVEAQSSSIEGTEVNPGSITVSYTLDSGSRSSSIDIISYSAGENSLYSFVKADG